MASLHLKVIALASERYGEEGTLWSLSSLGVRGFWTRILARPADAITIIAILIYFRREASDTAFR